MKKYIPERVTGKFYVIYHPIYGYKCGNKIHSYWSQDIDKSRKWRQRNFASSSLTQSHQGGPITEYSILEFTFLAINTTK